LISFGIGLEEFKTQPKPVAEEILWKKQISLIKLIFYSMLKYSNIIENTITRLQ